MSRFHDRLDAGQPAIGTIVVTTGPEWVDLLAHAGFDFVCIDQMVTAIDWSEAANMIRAAKQFNTSPWMRLQAYPWAGGGDRETLTIANVLRAISIGAEAVTVSVDTPEEATAILHPREELHRRIWIMGGHDPAASADTTRDPVSPDPILFPLIESLGAAERIEEFFDIDGLQTVFFGLGDLSRLLGVSSIHAPEVLTIVKNGVRAAEKAGKYVSVTAGSVAQPTVDEIANSVNLFWDLGVKVIWVPHPTYLLNSLYRQVLDSLKPLRSIETSRART
jgi:2-keto-3-deoxy-L-rhamnonate aldolase RhmA